jgi:V/A-type H+-transporting ATPase subunit E
MGLESLLEKITRDAEDQARALGEEARAQGAALVAARAAEATAQGQALLAEARAEAASQQAQQLAAAELAARDRILAAKNQAVDQVLAAAQARLAELPEGDYKAFLAARLAGERIPPGTEIALPEAYQGLDLGGLSPNLRLSAQQAPSGFILKSPETESDNTFPALLAEDRDALEALIVTELGL